jgi:hypothetical protein
MMMMYPTELWISIITAIAFVIIILLVFILPYIPHIFARISKSKILFMIDKNGTLHMKKAKLKGDMYEIKKNNYLFYKRYPGSYKFAGVDVDFVHADRGFVLKPELQAAIQELKEIYDINNYIELKKAIDDGKLHATDVEVPLFFTVPLDTLEEYGTEIPPTSIAAQVDDMYFTEKTGELNSFMKWMPYIIIILILIIGGALGYKIISG